MRVEVEERDDVVIEDLPKTPPVVVDEVEADAAGATEVTNDRRVGPFNSNATSSCAADTSGTVMRVTPRSTVNQPDGLCE